MGPLVNVEIIAPPPWLVRIVGESSARLLTFGCLALRTRPHIVGGFHLTLNGLAAALLARLTGARSMYFCVGGSAEIAGGGAGTEHRLFGRLGTADPVLERRLLRAVEGFDFVITMGRRTAAFLQAHSVRTRIHVVAGGFDARRFRPVDAQRTIDVILVARLVPIKRVDLFLHTIQLVAQTCPDVSVVVVGSGPLRDALEKQTRDLGLAGNVQFVGHQPDVERWLSRAKIFVLTSDSEGLALSLIEAMLCGLPAIVSHVGDLPDLVEHAVNGYLVHERSPQTFATFIIELLGDPDRLARFGAAARCAATRYEISATVRRWDDILASCEEPSRASAPMRAR